MDRRSRKSGRSNRINFTSEKGYLLVSTLFFLVFSAIFAGSMIRISGTQILQYNQITTAYEAKAALNLSETILLEHLETNETLSNGEISSSVGKIMISGHNQTGGTMYHLDLTTTKGLKFSQNVWVAEELPPEIDEIKEGDEAEIPKEKPESLEDQMIQKPQ